MSERNEGSASGDPAGDRSRSGEIEIPWNLVVPEADIYLVGYGNRMPNDFTLEMLAVLKSCKRIFGAPPIHAPSFGVPRMENLMVHYGPDKKRPATYREWLELILAAAAEEPPVAFATYGSAMAGTWVTHQLLEEAPRRGLSVHVTNAVSFLDGIWADLNIEPFYGFEIWEATGFVLLDIQPDTRAHLVLPQAPVFEVAEGPDMVGRNMKKSSTIAALRDHLLRFYPADHEVVYIRTTAGTGSRALSPDIERVRLADLDHPGRNQIGTLLVPGLDRPEKLDFRRPGTAQARPQIAVPAGV